MAPTPLACLEALNRKDWSSSDSGGGGGVSAWDLAAAALQVGEAAPRRAALQEPARVVALLLHADPAMRWALCRLLAVVLGLVCLLPLCFLVISVCRPASPPCCWPLLSAWCGTTPLNFQPFWLLHGLLTVASGLALFHPPCFPTRLLAAVFSLVCFHPLWKSAARSLGLPGELPPMQSVARPPHDCSLLSAASTVPRRRLLSGNVSSAECSDIPYIEKGPKKQNHQHC